MSDVWHRYDEVPKHQDIIMTDTGCWAYRADLLAFETENKDISNKIGKLEQKLECTRKALDIATKYIKHTQKVSPFWFNHLANETLDKIKTALEQKDVK